MKFKFILFLFILFLILVSVSLFLWNTNTHSTTKNANSKTQNNKSLSEQLSLSPQTPDDKIIVDSVTLSKDIYLVVREVIDGKLGQIVEISSPLKKGSHTNITISLGNADIKNKELLVMVYDDQNSDKIFNDFDQPTIDENGKMIGRYVKTGKPLPASIAEGNSSGTMNHTMAGMAKMVKVKYTDKGFIPERIEVPVGSMVEFVNESTTYMWVASAPHPSHTDLPTFDQFSPTKKGSVYRYIFDKKGAWTYHDHLYPNAGGVVTVK